MWRYRELMPLLDGEEPITLGEGFTPLLPARRVRYHRRGIPTDEILPLSVPHGLRIRLPSAPVTCPVMGAVPAVLPVIEVDAVFAVATA